MKKRLLDFYLKFEKIVETIIFGIIVVITSYGLTSKDNNMYVEIGLVCFAIFIFVFNIFFKKYAYSLEFPKNEYGNPNLEEMVDVKDFEEMKKSIQNGNFWGYMLNDDGTASVLYITEVEDEIKWFDWAIWNSDVKLYDIEFSDRK